MNKETKHPKRYSPGEEIFNSVSHGIGAGLSVAALVLLIVHAVYCAPAGLKPLYVTSFALFGATLIILYMSSTLYHALVPFEAKNVFQIFDHSSIYLLIAGTYTPFCLAALRGTFGWTLFGIIWGLAITGIVLYSVFGNRLRAISAVTYVILGWIIVFAFRPLIHVLPHKSLVFLIAGGIAYTAGCIFYALKKIKWMHSIFHLFVLAGSIFHFFSVYFMI
jgi:hemolysin III